MTQSEDIKFGLVKGKLNCSELYEWAKNPESGAVIGFGGTTRADLNSDNNSKVTSLVFESYEPLAMQTLERICLDVLNLEGVHKVGIVHRLGDVPLLEESVYIVVAAGHRTMGWRAAEYALEEVKAKLEVWKQEVFTNNESRWIMCGHKREH